MTSHSRQRLLSPERDRAWWRSMASFFSVIPMRLPSWVRYGAPLPALPRYLASAPISDRRDVNATVN